MNELARALVLDFGGVISRTIFETQPENERALGLPPGTLNWRGPFDPSGDPLWRAMQAGEISERDYYFTRARETGRLVGEDWSSLPQFLQRIRGADPKSAIRPEAIAAIESVKQADAKLAILSNELDLFYGPDFRAKLPFLADIDLIVDATHTGILKPDPRAYAFVTEGLTLAAEICVFVDDQIRNVRGAEAAGFRTIHFDVTRPAESYRAALIHFGL
ncbi:HAD-IA family hydrolase [Bradyrhizobium sp.]|uniref:HAD-IA family hydrolase n=1 Tax=Bradyrhizobium sp. TaxID=376 RepID=UPI001E179239|nr:HAD-IA family hydrolase [Bradyrhizobium sp.]MBI5319617.1 HAD-IA family hydrolase [Bradyrhizobium sp.]